MIQCLKGLLQHLKMGFPRKKGNTVDDSARDHRKTKITIGRSSLLWVFSQNWKRIASAMNMLEFERLRNTGGRDRRNYRLYWRKPGALDLLLPIGLKASGANKIFSASTKKVTPRKIHSEDYGLCFSYGGKRLKKPMINLNAHPKKLV